MKRGIFLFAWVLVVLFAGSFYLENVNFSGKAITGISSETDGCSQISQQVKDAIVSLNASENIIVKEGADISLGDFFVLPAGIFETRNIQTDLGVSNITIRNNISGEDFLVGIMPSGYGSASLGSQSYNFSLSGGIFSIDFPQTSNTLMIFNCSSACSPNWTAVNTSCANETRTIWYNDTNKCGVSSEKPANVTYSCDDDLNGIIGAVSSISQSNVQLSVEVANESLNISKIYNGTKRVDLKDNGTLIINFTYNFSNPLALNNLSIKKQGSTSSFGYIIVNGLEAEKTVYVSRKNSSSSVCIKDSSVSSVSSFSQDCDDGDETLLSCPDEQDGYSCVISGDYFVVSGLRHSGVKEFVSEGICVPSWNCTSWQNCTNGKQNRTCSDTNNCGSTSGRPALQQNCSTVSAVAICISNVSCGSWLPQECPKAGERTRTCTDKNGCVPAKTEKQSCEYKEKSNALLYIFLAAGFLILVIIIIAILVYLKQRRESFIANQPYNPAPPSQMPIIPPSPPFPPALQLQSISPAGAGGQNVFPVRA